MNINKAMQELAEAKARMDKVSAEQTATLARIADLESSLAAREIQLTPQEEQLVNDIKGGLIAMDDRIQDVQPDPIPDPAPTEEPTPELDAEPQPEEQIQ